MSFLFKQQVKCRIGIVFIFFLMILNASCMKLNKNAEYPENRVDLLITDDLENKEFLSLLLGYEKCDINSGIEIEKIKVLNQSGTPTQSKNYYSFLILNHAAEPVKFENIGFNIEVFEYYPNSKNGTWQKVNLPYKP